jgi:hypothetical protein
MKIVPVSRAPFCLILHLRLSLKWIDPRDLTDLAYIDLESEIDLPPDQQPEWYREATSPHALLTGAYCPELDQHRLPRIKLYFKNLCFGIPRIYWMSPVVTLQIARTLAHEVGHHVKARGGFVFDNDESGEEEELLVDQYASKVIAKMQSRAWYRFGTWLARDLACTHYLQGLVAWNSQQYAEAASSWKKSFNIDPSREDASYWYWRAIEKLNT